MSRGKWALLILLCIAVFMYFKLFYKTWSGHTVPASADCVAALDVKRVTNTLLWQFLTSPGQWKPGKLFTKRTTDTSWRDMFSIPDYVFAFHVKDQPADNWYVLLNKKTEAGFEAGLKKFAFEKLGPREFLSRENGFYLLVKDQQVLAARARAEDSGLVRKVADELLAEKKFIAREALQKAVDAKSHLAVYIAGGGLLQDAAVIGVNFDKEKLRINGTINPAKPYSFREERFLYNSGALFSSGITQPSPEVYSLLGAGSKERISRAINIDMDSVCMAGNSSCSLSVQNIQERADTAITYTYDDDFNKVEKRVVNIIQEPSFTFFINGKHTNSVYDYLQRNNKLEATADGDLFLPMPLVRSFVHNQPENSISITSFNYNRQPADATIQAVLFIRLGIATIPPDLYRYLPGPVSSILSSLDEFSFSIRKQNEQLQVTGMLTKRKNSPSLFRF